jgi:hypothetical protein
MPSPAEWSRADVIAALALMVSALAFIASGVSSFVSWRSYLAGIAARRPKLGVYFEPFENSNEWWIANFGIRNRSDHVLRFESVQIVKPFGVLFSDWLGGFTGMASGGGPMLYRLPDEVLSGPTVRKLTKVEVDGDSIDLEIGPSNESAHLATLIVKTPRWRLARDVTFQIDMTELGEVPKRVTFRVAAPFPTKQNTKSRY